MFEIKINIFENNKSSLLFVTLPEDIDIHYKMHRNLQNTTISSSCFAYVAGFVLTSKKFTAYLY